MFDLVYYLVNLLIFAISLLHYYINLKSSTIFCLYSGDIFLSLCISLPNPIFLLHFQLPLNYLWHFLNFISDFITNLITSCFCCFWIACFEIVLSASVEYWLAWLRNFGVYLQLTFLFIFLLIILPIFCGMRQNSIAL